MSWNNPGNPAGNNSFPRRRQMSSEEGEISDEEGEIVVDPPSGSGAAGTTSGPPPPLAPPMPSPSLNRQPSSGGNFPLAGGGGGPNLGHPQGGGGPPPHRGPPRGGRGWGRGRGQVSPFPRQQPPPQAPRSLPRNMSMTGGSGPPKPFPAAAPRSSSFTGYTPRNQPPPVSGNPSMPPVGRPTDPRFPPNDPRNRNNNPVPENNFRSFDNAPGGPGSNNNGPLPGGGGEAPPQPQPILGRMSSYSSLADSSVTSDNNNNNNSREPPPPGGGFDYRQQVQRSDSFRGTSVGSGPPGDERPPFRRDSGFPRNDSFGGEFRREPPPFREGASGEFGEAGAPPLPFRRGEFGEKTDEPGNFRPQRGGFRGGPGRRSNNDFGVFRNTSGPIRNSSSGSINQVGGGSEASYYGPGTAGASNNNPANNNPADFPRRSPSNRGRPIVRPGGPLPPPLRPVGGPPQRRVDPRFSKDLPPPPPPDAVRSGGGMDDSFYRSRSEDTSDAPFRQWQSHSSRQEPPPSPRKPPMEVTRSEPKPPPPPPPVVAPPPPTLPPPKETPAPEPEEAPLLTKALGEEHVERAEQAVALISDLLGKDKLKSSSPGESVLPAMDSIVMGMQRLASSVKAVEKEAEEKQEELGKALEAEKAEELKAAQLKTKLEEEEKARQEAERVRLEEERARKQEVWLREKEEEEKAEIEEFVAVKQKELEKEEQTALEDLESRLTQAKKDEQLRQEKDVDAQLGVAAESLDKEIAEAQRDYDRAVDSASRAKAKIAAAEADKSDEARPSTEEQTSEDVVAQILAANQRRAAEAHLCPFAVVSEDDAQDDDCRAGLEKLQDPLEETSFADWAGRADQVTGLSDALYSEPSEAPFFKQNEAVHSLIGPLVTEYVRNTQNRLTAHWTGLAEEYEFRRETYKKRHGSAGAKGKQRRSASVVRHSIFGTRQEAKPIADAAAAAAATAASAGRASGNPYRTGRPRRGNEVRSEYEQEQIIKELSAKEALEKRIASGRSDLPHQIGNVERKLLGTFVNTFKAQRVDLMAQEAELAIENVWTDLEKCIFLDRFLQHPKDFRKIASFLRNKTTRDCVQFYYDSKQSLPYKEALREHIMRRKRRGDYHVWDATIQAALSVGAVVEAGPGEDKPVIFHLPKDDNTYTTRLLHPLKLEVFDAMHVQNTATQDDEGDEDQEPEARRSSRKRRRHQLFILDPDQAKFLRTSHQDVSSSKTTSRSPVVEMEASDDPVVDMPDRDEVTGPSRKAPQKWTVAEKKIFLDTLEKYGRNWDMLSEAVGTKSISQIKNYYYDYKKQAGKLRPEKKSGKSEALSKGRNDQDDLEAAESQTESMLDSSMIEKREEAQPPPLQHASLQDSLPVHLPSHRPADLTEAPSMATSQSATFEQSLDLQAQAAELLARQRELEHGLPRSGATTPDTLAAELWAQAQQQALLHQHSQTQIREAAARQLLLESQAVQNHSLLSSLLPWVSSQQVQQHLGHNINLQDWSENQQLRQSLMQQLQRPQQQHPHTLAGLTNSSHLGMTLAGMGGLGNTGATNFNGLGLEHPTSSDDGSQQLLLQQLIALQREAPSTSAAEALSLLARALPDSSGHNSGRNSFPGSDNSR